MSVNWNLWHGCKKVSAGCENCYVYRSDAKYDRDASEVKQTASFDLPVKKKRDGSYKVAPGEMVYTCFTSDFLLDAADVWRPQAWDMMRQRQDLHFMFFTKRPHRFLDCVPPDWGEGYKNVTVGCSVENAEQAKKRLEIFTNLPIQRKLIICSPLLSAMDLTPYLNGIKQVAVVGESGENARVCDFDWVLDIRRQCIEAGVPFHFQQTGARLKKDGKLYKIKRKFQHAQARRANLEYSGER